DGLAHARAGVDSTDISHAATLEQVAPTRDRIGLSGGSKIVTIRRPLDGMLVLDMGQIYNGPYAGLQLSFMGARVLKIEPPDGDVLRRRKRETEPYPLVMLNSNKESIVLDLKQPRAKEIFLALVAKADVLI